MYTGSIIVVVIAIVLIAGRGKKEEWIEFKMADLLPTSYYHVVFTLPHELNPLIMHQRTALFQAALPGIGTYAAQPRKRSATPRCRNWYPLPFYTPGDRNFPFTHMFTALSVAVVYAMPYGFPKNVSGTTSYFFLKAAMQKIFKGFFDASLACAF